MKYSQQVQGSPQRSDNIVKATDKTLKSVKLGGSIVDGSYDRKATSTSAGSEIGEKYSPIYPKGPPQSEAEFFYENELFKKKISEF